MAHSLSAKKRHRQSLRRRERNLGVRTASRTAVRKARAAIGAGGDEAAEAVREASSVLDRAARKGVIHKNNAARHKSRLMRQLGGAAPAPAAAKTRGRGRTKKR